MKRIPTVYSATDIATWHVSEEHEPGVWRPARPCAIKGWRFMERLRAAWMVFTGKWDALRWGNNSGEWSNQQVNYRDLTEPGFIRAGKEKEQTP
jgi:hypothetical protein